MPRANGEQVGSGGNREKLLNVNGVSLWSEEYVPDLDRDTGCTML